MTTSVLETLVGEGKKFSDAEALAKGKLAADEHIANLNTQLETLKAQVASGASVSSEALDKILAEIKSQSNTQVITKPDTSVKTNNNQNGSALTEEQIVSIINKQNQAQAENRVRAETLSKVASVYGAKSDEFLTKLAADTGFTLDQLKSLAGTQPNAFLRIANLNNNQTTSTATSSVNSQAITSNVNSDGSVRNKAWYDAKMKQMGAWKFAQDASLQAQLHRDAMRPEWDT